MSTFGSEALPGNLGGYYALGLAALIPGYFGYGKRDGRENADRELRRHILARIAAIRSCLADAPSADGPAENSLEILRRLDDLSRKIDSGAEGLQSFFTAGDLTEAAVDEIHAYDRKIVDHLEMMVSGANACVGPQWPEHLDHLERLVDERSHAISRVTA